MGSESDDKLQTTGKVVEEEEDDDVPQLSADTLAALTEFYSEQEALRELLEGSLKVKDSETGSGQDDGEVEKDKLFKIDMGKSFPEDWQLSQFWYDEDTSKSLADEVLKQAGDSGTVACISCPSIFRACDNSPNVTLFEYDKRFKAFGSSFHFYDYNNPKDIPESCVCSFSVVVADPPFLSEECLEKVAVTVKRIMKSNGKILLCTGAVMEPVAERVLGLKRSSFVPQHKHNLGLVLEYLEFHCYTVSFCKKDSVSEKTSANLIHHLLKEPSTSTAKKSSSKNSGCNTREVYYDIHEYTVEKQDKSVIPIIRLPAAVIVLIVILWSMSVFPGRCGMYAIGVVVLITYVQAWNTVVAETLLVVSSLGIQVHQTNILGKMKYAKFVPIENIKSVIINEIIRRHRVIAYLLVLLDSKESTGKVMVPLLIGTLPRLRTLEKIYCQIQQAGFKR